MVVIQPYGDRHYPVETERSNQKRMSGILEGKVGNVNQFRDRALVLRPELGAGEEHVDPAGDRGHLAKHLHMGAKPIAQSPQDSADDFPFPFLVVEDLVVQIDRGERLYEESRTRTSCCRETIPGRSR